MLKQKLTLSLLLLNLNFAFSQTGNSNDIANDGNITTIVVAVILTAIATSAGQYAVVFWIRKKEKKLKHKRQLKLLISEIEDLMRHCYINLAILKIIDLEKGKPSDLHFEKMKIITDSSILFSTDTFTFISSKYTKHINRLRLNIRNINLEIDKILSYIHKDDFDSKKLGDYINYLIKKFELSLDRNLPERIATLKKAKIDVVKKEAKDIHEKDLESVVNIILYD
ncbi:hypothetical protein [Pedobacter namyangjuensis]|uniref:hypothetical protein n=1 Tax=Pedobacter namyangjuensis TaxID=600626 RepID=UPI000DE305D1|nr:hypothetical protein [Pedobacter namyangjuensis]